MNEQKDLCLFSHSLITFFIFPVVTHNWRSRFPRIFFGRIFRLLRFVTEAENPLYRKIGGNFFFRVLLPENFFFNFFEIKTVYLKALKFFSD